MFNDDQTAMNNEIITREIIKSWILLQNEEYSESAFRQHILSHLSQIVNEHEKISYILKIKTILKQQLLEESFLQSQAYNKKANLKDMLFKHLLFLILLEIEKDFVQKMEISKLIREQEIEFLETLEKVRKEQKKWESDILEHGRRLIERMERAMFINILFYNVKNSIQLSLTDEVIKDIRTMVVEFLEQSGFDIQQMREYQSISEKSINQFSKTTAAFEVSLSQLDTLDAKKFVSEKDIDSTVEKQVKTIQQKLQTILNTREVMHKNSKEFIRATIVKDKKPEDNIRLYEKLVEGPSNKRLTIFLNKLIDQKTNKRLMHYKIKPAIYERSFRGREAGKLFELEMKHLETKLQELAVNKKKQLKTSRIKFLALHKEHGKFTRSQLNPAESLHRLKSRQVRFADSVKKTEDGSKPLKPL